jgi:hypothetical protein
MFTGEASALRQRKQSGRNENGCLRCPVIAPDDYLAASGEAGGIYPGGGGGGEGEG